MDKDKLAVSTDKDKRMSLWPPTGIDIRESRFPSYQNEPPERKIPSPYDVAEANRQYKKIYPNRVYTPWYRRYVNKLPDVETIDFQPFDEVQKIDEDIAMQYFYGEDAHLSHQFDNERRKTALQRYRKVKEQEERVRLYGAPADNLKMGPKEKIKRFPEKNQRFISTMETEFGATALEKKTYNPIVEFLQKLHKAKQRLLRKVVVHPRSVWHVVKSPAVMLKLRTMYKRRMQDQIHSRFRKIIKLVVAVIRFIDTIRFISGDTKKILKEIENFLTSQSMDTKKTTVYGMKKKVFEPHKYNINKKLHIPFDTKMTLTKPWFTRRSEEIDEVVAALQSYKSFVQYPPLFQRRLATLAWYIETQADKYIIRERHIACDFYVLLTGKAKVVKMRGSPYIFHNGELSFIRYIRKSEGFGDESMSDPECEREYSVISTEPCALLSISVHDYLQMLSTRKDDEFAPEHIIFLCNLKLMDNFPRVKLLEEGNENITIHYFRPETVVSKNLEESNFVFVVFSGSCQLLVEIYPEVLATPKREQFTRQTKQSFRKRSTIKGDPSFTKVIGAKGKFTKSTPHATCIQQQIDSQRRGLEPMFTATRFLINDYIDKTQQILQTLPREQRDALYAKGLPSTLFSKDQTNPNSSREEATRPLNLTLDNFFSRMSSLGPMPEVVENIETSNPSVANIPSKETMEVKLNSKTVTVSDAVEFTATMDHLTGQESFVSCSEKDESITDMKKPPKDDYLRKIFGLEKRPHVPIYSRWRLIRTLTRGDYTGQEWLNYMDGPFEPPEDTMSLVSHGCEMVMVKKSFLLKYLKKEW